MNKKAFITQTFDYPKAEKLKSSLVKIVKDNYWASIQGGGSRTGFDLHKKDIKEMNTLLSWIQSKLPRVAYNFSQGGEDAGRMDTVGFNVNGFKIEECWGVYYKKGEGVVKHNHFPYAFTFQYCVDAPNTSAPFIIEGKKVALIPGKTVFFLSHQYHWAKPIPVDGRCVIIGNILYER